jgi:hypothetical protein
MTREALRLYLDALRPDGIIAFHISNRHLRLEPVVAGLAEDGGLRGRLLIEDPFGDEEDAISSTLTVLARRPEAFGALAADVHWTALPLEPDPRVGVWTDDFHSLLSVFKW